MKQEETIAALASAPGEGAIAVIRLSGPKAFPIFEATFSKKIAHFPTHTAHYGKILSRDQKILDAVLILLFKAPRSYTGEDSVEIFCHGGKLIYRRILERLFEEGARPAEPGEFSFRSFRNGKIDLAQAEAIQELISAKSEEALDHAEKQLEGALSQQIRSFQKEMIETASILEAWVDFPEEGLEFATKEEILDSLEKLCQKMERLAATFYDGQALKEGFSLCLFGAPNVGKSSLMNALLGKERAIVTPIAGTTRDLLEEELRIGSLSFRLIDTAGIRETQELIEQEGVRRSKRAKEEADLLLLLLDATRPLNEEERELLREAPKEKTLIIWNKIDAVQQVPEDISGIPISAKEKVGLEPLKKAMEELLWKKRGSSKEEVLLTKLRHRQALLRSVDFCRSVIEGLQSEISAEFVVSDLRAALNELGQILGLNVTEEILSAIFAKFCVGK